MTKHWKAFVTASLATLLTLITMTPLARADIFQWEYINPTNPGDGKQPSTTLAPDGGGVNAVPLADLSSRNMTTAYLLGANLPGANFTQANLTQAAFSGSGGIYSSIPGATLTDANFSQAILTNADFGGYTGNDGEGDYHYFGANLTGATLVQANLSNASFRFAALTNANLSQTKLNANFGGATLTGANLTGADVRGTSFNREFVGHPHNLYAGSGISLTQLYSTASYQDDDLTGIGLQFNDLGNGDLSDQNLTGANFTLATLSGANLSQANLTNAAFYYADLTGANLTGADVRGAHFKRYGNDNGIITPAQLYSTASYLAHDLTGIELIGNYTGLNLADQNLTNSDFRIATLTDATLRQANLSNANFSGFSFPEYDEDGNYLGTYIGPGANLTGANLSGADARGANFQNATLSGVNTSNLIKSNGHIAGLDVLTGALLVVRDYDGNLAAAPPTGPLPIVVEQHLAMDAIGTLRLEFDADPWDSTISFLPGIPVTLGGTLKLSFAPGVDVAAQSSRTIDLFDWTGVTPIGAFTVSSPYTWNLSQLYTTGEVTLIAAPSLPGDFNNNGTVDAADYVVWRKTDGTQASYDTWRAHFGQTTGSGAALPSAEPLSAAVPEPATLALLAVGLPLLVWRKLRRRRT